MKSRWTDIVGYFGERAAIAEYDGCLPRAEAEKQAIGETYDWLRSHAEPVAGIFGELLLAFRWRDDPELEGCCARLGVNHGLVGIWGFDAIVVDGEGYRPAFPSEPSRVAAILPVRERSTLIDLVACGINSQRHALRLGVGEVLGDSSIDDARETGSPLMVFDNIINWLRGCCHGAVILD